MSIIYDMSKASSRVSLALLFGRAIKAISLQIWVVSNMIYDWWLMVDLILSVNQHVFRKIVLNCICLLKSLHLRGGLQTGLNEKDAHFGLIHGAKQGNPIIMLTQSRCSALKGLDPGRLTKPRWYSIRFQRGN